MEKIFRFLIFVIAAVLVLIPLALLGTCSLLGGAGAIVSSLTSINIGMMISSILLGVLLIILGWKILKFVNRADNKLQKNIFKK